MIAKFYMRGGHVLTVTGVKDVVMTRTSNSERDGAYGSYRIEWKSEKHAPELFTVSIPDIVAVTVEKTLWELATT